MYPLKFPVNMYVRLLTLHIIVFYYPNIAIYTYRFILPYNEI